MNGTMVIEARQLLSSAELYLCLSRAFQLGQQTITLEQMREALLPDLQQLAEALPALSPAMLRQLEDDLGCLPDTDALMREFSRLFLMPPAPAPLNLGFYLDGGMMGNTPVMLEAFYHRYGLARSDHFHDVSDHLSLILHWLAWVYAQVNDPITFADQADEGLQDAAQVIARYTLPGLDRLIETLQGKDVAVTAGAIWLHLLQLLQAQLQEDLARLRGMQSEELFSPVSSAEAVVDEGMYGKHADIDKQLNCQQCGRSFAAGRILAEMIDRLQAADVSTRHVEVCETCRDTGDNQGRSSVVLQHRGCG
ncbi:TorD/DmsD family molecular chaperone [Nitrincola alkalilacustris]|uniref:TorD/DmsD family molecular chaperone n=1 Tax=Nitrincola alkalilacustris TaxID=1571224 RepID=UPI00124C71D6|nr:molecular chaperone TorD family protein [Nitrincola alkalilacustris]